jgi:glutathione S-transferase
VALLADAAKEPPIIPDVAGLQPSGPGDQTVVVSRFVTNRGPSPKDLQIPAYLQLNPNARIPTLVDGEVVLWESMAISLYLAQRPGPMRLSSAAALGLATQWRFWAMHETEALLLDLLAHRILLAEHVRDPSHVERNTLLRPYPLV